MRTLDLGRYPRRVAVMVSAAAAALGVDFASKHLAVAIEPRTLLFHVSPIADAGLGESAILLILATSLLACVVPVAAVAVGAGVALGGALGNLLSRRWWESRGGSPDFIPFSDGSTGNLADVFILIGAATMLLGCVGWLLWATLLAHRRHT